MSKVVLWDYPHSSASYRVRIALNLAGIAYDAEQVDLSQKAHRAPEHLARNPQGLVPVLDIDGHRIAQSLAIIEYLDETRALEPRPQDPAPRAALRALAYIIAVDLHPVCNMSVALHATQGQEPARTNWMHHFIRPALLAFETRLAAFAQTPFATGDAPSLADICLIPQLYNARRWGVDYSGCARIRAVEAACQAHSAFRDAAPDSA